MNCMKKNLFFPVVLILSFFLISCEEENLQLITFEEVALSADSIWNGSDGSGKFSTAGFNFNNSYNAAWFSWSGFACSAKKDTKTIGWANQYSVIAGVGAAKSAKFALAFDSASVATNSAIELKSAMLTNSTYTYFEIKDGSKFSKKFVAGDWFKVIITGYNNKVKTSSVEYYLADFRNSKTFLSNAWAKVDLSTLGTVNQITFTFDSSDKGDYGVNTPQYVCIDNIEYVDPTVKK